MQAVFNTFVFFEHHTAVGNVIAFCIMWILLWRSMSVFISPHKVQAFKRTWKKVQMCVKNLIGMIVLLKCITGLPPEKGSSVAATC